MHPGHSIDLSNDTPMQVLARIQLVKLEVDALVSEARTCNNPERLRAIGDEVEIRLESMREIRRQQLERQIITPKKQQRPWWRFW